MRLPISPLSRRHSIGAKIFAAFVAMGLITGALGAYGFYVLSAAGKLVVETYDGPLMAINFARSASLTFNLMDKEALRRNIVPPSERAAVENTIETLGESFFEDLDVVEKRAVAADQHQVIADIRRLVGQWLEQLRGSVSQGTESDLNGLEAKIIDRFDVLIELTADYSFIERRKAVWSISYFQYTSIAVSVLALVLSAGITLLLARRIIRPLSAAATVADRIAGGGLQTPIPDGGKDETGILLRSMTVMQDNIRAMMEREMAEKRSAQRRLIDALESSREGMVLVDADGKIVIANSQFAVFCPAAAPYMFQGADFAAAFAHIRPLLAWSADSDDEARAVIEDGPAHEQFASGEYQMTDGRWIRFSRSKTQDGGFFLFLSDFTEIKAREEHFKEAKLQAEVASNAKTNFLANMSHELRTPLNAIIGFSEIITNQLFGKVGNHQYVDYADNILKSGRHLLGIIGDVLDLAKTETGKLELQLEPVDMNESVGDGAATMAALCEAGQLRLVVDRSNGPLMVLGDPSKLRQIVLNLLSNAVKFTKPGGAVVVSARPNADGDAEIRIADTGIGMSQKDIEVALTPFGQVDSTLARSYQGTGLGLPLAAAFVELHAGRLDIVSEPGKGTTVTITLPKFAADDESTRQGAISDA